MSPHLTVPRTLGQGRWDVGWRNPGMLTPHLDSLVQNGVELKDYYTFKVCGPSRSSILSGRYPFNVGYVRFGSRPSGPLAL
jgi:arylsulfatase A-like enzyme